ncbi:hypothetical protein LXL04_015329 [Taraxacum kok-saghyz]
MAVDGCPVKTTTTAESDDRISRFTSRLIDLVQNVGRGIGYVIFINSSCNFSKIQLQSRKKKKSIDNLDGFQKVHKRSNPQKMSPEPSFVTVPTVISNPFPTIVVLLVDVLVVLVVGYQKGRISAIIHTKL